MTGGSEDQGHVDAEGRLALQEGWWSAGVALLATLAIVVLALAAPLAVHNVLKILSGGDGGQGLAQSFKTLGWAPVLTFQVAVVLLVLLIGGGRRRLGCRSLAEPGSWIGPFVVTVIVSAVTAVIAYVFFADILERDLKPIRELVHSAPLWLGFVALAIGAPLSEELLFRGFLLHRLARTPLGFWPGAVVANTGWTALHLDYSWLSLADVFLAGLLFSWALWRTRSVWVPISFHAIYNATVFFIFLIPSTNPSVAVAM